MTNKEVEKLLEKYNAGKSSEEDKILLESWYLQYSGKDFDLQLEELSLLKEASWHHVDPQQQKIIIKQSTPSRIWLNYAAAILAVCIISLGLLFYFNPEQDLKVPEIAIVNHDLSPGTHRATLTLHDGTVVSLDDSATGVIAQEQGVKISKTAEGQIVYLVTAKTNTTSKKEKYNQITTPKGGQYQVILPDGTKVWLNAASSLKYPEQFDLQTRSVELHGEAYFEVKSRKSASGKNIPFLVKTFSQTVEVLGTQFNINAYDDENDVKTTLIEGLVQVSSQGSTKAITSKKANTVLLYPNQQSVLTENAFNVLDVNAQESIAWKNGYFIFDHANLETVMRQLSRWYDVEIIYKGNSSSETFTGKFQRNMNLLKVLEILEFAQVKFKIEGKKMIIFS